MVPPDVRATEIIAATYEASSKVPSFNTPSAAARFERDFVVAHRDSPGPS